jgi:hypothetical protein
MSVLTAIPLLEVLLRELETAGESRYSKVIKAALSLKDAELERFLGSNELWGGAGSVADEAGVSVDRKRARAIEAAMIELGREQLRLGVTNPRTASWVHAFSEWQRQGI